MGEFLATDLAPQSPPTVDNLPRRETCGGQWWWTLGKHNRKLIKMWGFECVINCINMRILTRCIEAQHDDRQVLLPPWNALQHLCQKLPHSSHSGDLVVSRIGICVTVSNLFLLPILKSSSKTWNLLQYATSYCALTDTADPMLSTPSSPLLSLESKINSPQRQQSNTISTATDRDLATYSSNATVDF